MMLTTMVSVIILKKEIIWDRDKVKDKVKDKARDRDRARAKVRARVRAEAKVMARVMDTEKAMAKVKRSWLH